MGQVGAVLTGHGQTEIGPMVLDVTLSESHSHSATSVTSPVEDGTEVEDHTRQEPDEITLEGMWTDTPKGATKAELNRSQEKYEQLVNIKERGEALDVVTGLKVYENMVIQSISSTRDPSTGYTVPMSVTLKEQRRVSQQLEEIPAPVDAASDPVKHSAREATERGQQKSEPASEEEEKNAEDSASVLHSWLN